MIAGNTTNTVMGGSYSADHALYNFSEQVKNLFEDMDLKLEFANEPKYVCDCSRERVEKALISIGEKDLQEIYNEQKDEEVVCHFCNKKYVFTPEDIKELLEKAK